MRGAGRHSESNFGVVGDIFHSRAPSGLSGTRAGGREPAHPPPILGTGLRALQCSRMKEMEERRLVVENLRTQLELLENERRILLRELAMEPFPAHVRAEKLQRHAGLLRARDEAIKTLRSFGESVD